MDLMVFSSKRDSDADNAGASVTINNNSDMTLNIKVINDDTSAPRFNIESANGSIKFYR